MPTTNLDATAKQILDAASRRFLHYGYKKTTMSEIANDCNMSTGNLYRYFPSKLDIAEMFVAVLRRDHVATLRKILEAPHKTPAEKLRELLNDSPQLHVKVQGILGADVVEKLRHEGLTSAHPSRLMEAFGSQEKTC